MNGPTSPRNLISFLEMIAGGIYLFQGLDSSDYLTVWMGEQVDRDSWTSMGDLQRGDVMMVVGIAQREFNARGVTGGIMVTGIFIDFISKLGSGWIFVDHRFAPHDESDLFQVML